MAPTTVGVIGCGLIARSAHLPGLQAASAAGLATVVGVCDVVAKGFVALAFNPTP